MTPSRDWYEPLVMPGIMTFFGVLVCWMGWLAERNGKSASWKWVGILLLAAGIWFGFPYFSVMVGSSPEDQLYRAGMPSIRRFAYAHYLAFLLPLLALAGCVILQFVKKPETPAEAAE